ncbi:hypothetical protein CRYUN_Cryun25bG0004500 [Craigia yunnanensis]
MMVINTVLSVMAYDYPQEKLSVYLSDDAGSYLTFYALLEASQFAKHWIPFCKKLNVEPRSPAAYIKSISDSHDTKEAKELATIKKLYKAMENRIEAAAKLGRLSEELRFKHKGFSQWDSYVSQRDHDTILQILIDGKTPIATDVEGCRLPSLVYLAREKRPQHFHNFKAGAMNALIRVSSRISNGRIILNVDCDMYSNNSQSVRDALCFFMDQKKGPEIAYVQFPQNFDNITKNEVYSNSMSWERKVEFHGLEDMEVGLKYGCPVEDVITGLSIQSLGWKSVYYNPARKAFLGVATITLGQTLVQHKRCSEGDFQFSKYSPAWYAEGKISLGLQLGYCCYCFWASNSLSVLFFSIVPSLYLLRGISLFPQLSSPWFIPFAYVIFSMYTYSLVEFLWSGGTVLGWWNDQRIWLYKRTSSYLSAFINTIANSLRFSADSGFVITAKVSEQEVHNRYLKEMMEFGVSSPMFTILATSGLVNLLCMAGLLKKMKIGFLKFVAVILLAFLCIPNAVFGIRFVMDREECFSHNVKYDGETSHVSFVVIKADSTWHSSHEGVNLVGIVKECKLWVNTCLTIALTRSGNRFQIPNFEKPIGCKGYQEFFGRTSMNPLLANCWGTQSHSLIELATCCNFQVKGPSGDQIQDYRDNNKSPYYETVDFDVHESHFTYYDQHAKDEHFNPLLEQISKLEEALYNIQFEQHWLEAQTERQAIVNEAMSKRAVHKAFYESAALIGASVLQVYLPRRLFERKLGMFWM